MTKDEARSRVTELVEKYEAVKKAGQIKKYSEEDTKKGFIVPLFQALGWDFEDRDEVSSEEHVKSSGFIDYGFYLNGAPRLYLEAKKLSADIHDEAFAKQAIRYSWNRGVTWAVLTDFESLMVFYAQSVSKHLGDKLYFEITYDKYLERFDELWRLSKDGFANNVLDQDAERSGKKYQKISVTDSLYKDLNESRAALIKSFSTWNKERNIPDDLLEEGVQRFLDRLIFIRVAEDRELENPTLLPMLRSHNGSSSPDFFKDLVSKFRELDEIYNSNLFAEHPLESWEEYDNTTRNVIEKLHGNPGYYEYDFKAIPADILGSVYENYLGYKFSQSEKGIEVSKDSRKRKEQGIYYTPTYIVDYIVANALKPVLDKCETVEDIQKIKVLDPACGSGSFLISAMEMIFEWYKKYNPNADEFTKISILKNNIYGVDLDEQAVEIARLNLLINALDSRMKLPDLSGNIKNGNSLVSGKDAELEETFGKNYRDKKPFNWHEEFPQVFDREDPGFDVIIGNPPYIFARGGNFKEAEKKYYYEHYKLQQYQINTFSLFIELGYSLLKNGGDFGFIVPNNWLTIGSFSRLREFLLKNTKGLTIINAIDSVFGQASVDTCTLVFQKGEPTNLKLGELGDGVIKFLDVYEPSEFFTQDFIIRVGKNNDSLNAILKRFEEHIPLSELANVKSGLKAYEVGKGIPAQSKQMKDDRIYHSKEASDKSWLKYLDGVDVGRYRLGWSGEYIKYGKNLAASRTNELFHTPRILVRQIPSKPPYCINAVFTDEIFINDLNSNNIFNPVEGYNLKYILGIINSKLISYWFISTFDKLQRKIFPQFKVNELARFPIHSATPSEQKEISLLVDSVMSLEKSILKEEENSNKWHSIKLEIEKTNDQIDQLVYELYKLNPAEISLVENKKI